MIADPHLWLAWAVALWRASWQGGLALLLVWAICFCWKNMPPSVREWLWRLAYLKLLLALLCVGVLTLSILPTLPHPPASHIAAWPAPAPVLIHPSPPIASPTPVSAVTVPAAHPVTIPTSTLVPPHHWQFTDALPMLGVLWLVGLGVGMKRLWLALRQVQRTRRAAHPIEDEAVLRLHSQLAQQMGVRRAPRLLAHPTMGPLLLGSYQPVIIVPEAMLAGDGAELHLALAHELAHVRRHDILWGWLPALVELLFFHRWSIPRGASAGWHRKSLAMQLALRSSGATHGLRRHAASTRTGHAGYHPAAGGGGHTSNLSHPATAVSRHACPHTRFPPAVSADWPAGQRAGVAGAAALAAGCQEQPAVYPELSAVNMEPPALFRDW